MTTCQNPQLFNRKSSSLLYGLSQKNQVRLHRRDMPVLLLKSLVQPRLIPVIERIFEIPELFNLVDIISLGENQLHHVIRMAEAADRLPEQVLEGLDITREALITAILFHDIGKGPETDDWQLVSEAIQLRRVPDALRAYDVPEWAEYLVPLHRHIAKSIQIAEAYHLDKEIIRAIALHHHIKITPEVLTAVTRPLALTPLLCSDILQFRPAQYAVRGSNLAQLLAILDQLGAIERKFHGRVFLSAEPDKLEDEVVKDLIIGVAEKNDPRLDLLGFDLDGRESVILLDLCSFGEFVETHTEYQVQAVKKDVLNTIRSLTRANGNGRNRDAVGLIGGDEFVIITSVSGPEAMEKMTGRITSAIKTRTGLGCRVGFGTGEDIPENFHQARFKANEHKTRRSQTCGNVGNHF